MAAQPPRSGPYRVVQWATGNIGLRSLRAVIEHPDLELVGVYVYSDAKAGRDAGDLCGVAPTGVVATRDVEDDPGAAKPDCVLYMADRADIDVLCRLLESGANVVTTRSEFHRPAGIDPAVRERIEAACRQGGASLHSTGSSPGFITEAMPLVLTSVQRRLDRLTIEEFADMSSRNSPELIFDLMGFGRDPATFDPRGVELHGGAAFGGSLGVVADALATAAATRSSRRGEVAVARHDGGDRGRQDRGRHDRRAADERDRHATGPAAADLQRQLVPDDGRRAGVGPARDGLAPDWSRVTFPLDVDIRFPVPPDEWAATSPGVTAHRPVNAIPYVCAAEPGIRTITDLPQIVARLG